MSAVVTFFKALGRAYAMAKIDGDRRLAVEQLRDALLPREIRDIGEEHLRRVQKAIDHADPNLDQVATLRYDLLKEALH